MHSNTKWKCAESRVDNKHLYYGSFILSPLMKSQADTIGIAIQRVLLGEIEGTCIVSVKFENVLHEYSMIVGIEESVNEILINLNEIILKSNLNVVRDAYICVRGPKRITAQDIMSPLSVEIVDTTQHIVNLTEPIDLCIELQIKRDCGYRMKSTNDFSHGSFRIDIVSTPVRNVNHSIHSYGNGNEKEEIIFIEIWLNESLTPKEALYEAYCNLIDLLISFLHAEEEDLEENEKRFNLPSFSFKKN